MQIAFGLTITRCSPFPSAVCRAIRRSLEQCVWVMQSVSLPSRAGWREWCADLKETKDFVLIAEKRTPATASIGIFTSHLVNPDITEICWSAKQRKKKSCDSLFLYFSSETQLGRRLWFRRICSFAICDSKTILFSFKTWNFMDSGVLPFVFDNCAYL